MSIDVSAGAACALCCACSCILTLIIVLSLSFQYVDYDELALKKNSHTNKVSLDEVYDNGRYCWGPSYKTMTFPALWERLDVKAHISNTEGVSTLAQFTLFYQLQLDGLLDLYKKYDLRYATMLESQTQAEIKNKGITYSFEDFLTQREEVTKGVGEAVKELITKKDGEGLAKFPGVKVEKSKFFLGEVKIDSEDLMRNYLQKAIALENNSQKEFEKKLAEEETITINQQQDWIAQGKTKYDIAVAEATKMIAIAEQQKKEAVIAARAQGLADLMTDLEITDDKVRKDFLMLMAILDNEESVVLNTDANVHVYTDATTG